MSNVSTVTSVYGWSVRVSSKQSLSVFLSCLHKRQWWQSCRWQDNDVWCLLFNRNLIYAGPLFQIEYFLSKVVLLQNSSDKIKLNGMKNRFGAPRLPRGLFLCYISHLLGSALWGCNTRNMKECVTNMASTLYSEFSEYSTQMLSSFFVIFRSWHILEPLPSPPFPLKTAKLPAEK